MKESHVELDNQVFKALYLTSPVASYVCNDAGYLIAFNEAASAVWGCLPKLREAKWSGAVAHYHPDGRPMPLDELPVASAVNAGPESGWDELVIERPDGTRRTVLMFAKRLDMEGMPTALHITLVDVTDFRQNEEKQAMLSEIVQSTDDAIVSKTLDGTITSWNAAAERVFGYKEDEIVGKSIETLIPAYLKAEEGIIIGEIKAGNQISHYQTIRITKSGKEIPISLTISPIRNKHGRIIGASKIARDISDKIQREQTIQFHAQKLETLHAIGKVISEKLDTPSLIQTVIDSTTHLAAADVGLCFYRISDEQGHSKLSVAMATQPNGRREYDGHARLEEGAIHAIFSGEGLLRFNDLAEVPHVRALFETNGEEANVPAVRHCLAIPIRANDGLLIGAMFFGYAQSDIFEAADEAVMRNIVSLVAVTLDNARLFVEVNALNLKKNEFIALASHELKTPLTTVKGYLQILERSEIDQVGRRFLTKALKQLERINALIAELLDISKIEAGKLSFHFEQIDIAELMMDVVETFHFSSQTHTVFVNNTRGDFTVEADRQRMEQVFINLITNAIKYSPDANSVHVMLESSPQEVSVQVRDEGVGMRREQQEKVFTRFYQVEGTLKMAGLGLGLYLSKEIVERHGGHIGVTSEIGKGSTFYFSIPRTQN